MNNHDDLRGTFVLVHPELLNDPAEKKNQVGVISSADLYNDNIVVSFSDGSESLFSTDALLVMGDTEEIRRYADYDVDLLPREDYFDIMEVCITAETEDLGGQKAAIQLASKNPMALEYAMLALNHELGLNRHKSPGR
jgi:hypothetical protein